MKFSKVKVGSKIKLKNVKDLMKVKSVGSRKIKLTCEREIALNRFSGDGYFVNGKGRTRLVKLQKIILPKRKVKK